jgi:leucyl/phenylalanyl-tRNA--protein transferase
VPWGFPDPSEADEHGIVGAGADLEPETLLQAYASGIFPMPLRGHAPMVWWSPDPRGVVAIEAFRPSRSLRRSIRRFEVRIDTAFAEVLDGCADPRRPHGWITPEIRRAYTRLHELGHAHSVEVYDSGGGLAGGLYGVEVGGLFAGESMFHRQTDASKVALAALVERLREAGGRRLLDVQWLTDHLASLGAVEIGRDEYLTRLRVALGLGPALGAGGAARLRPDR